MNNKSSIVRLYLRIVPLLVLLIVSSSAVLAQDPVPVPVDADGNSIVSAGSRVIRTDAIETQLPAFTASELEEFVGPIALYPDNLLAIILPASTYPLQIVLAARFLDRLASDNSLEPDASWDESVIALLNYPEVVQMMNQNIQWTWQLGEAVVNQEADVLTAIKSFRDLAYAAGNLKSDEFQDVSSSGTAIVITQVDETVVYVPYYVPEEVIVYQTQPVYHYYPTAYPVYYYPYAAGHHFIADYFWGVTSAFTIGWSDHHLHVYHPSYSHHPYNGYHYDSSHHYRRPNLGAFNRFYVDNHHRTPTNRFREGSYWRPQGNSGSRPTDRRNRNNIYSAADVRTVSNDRRGRRASNDNRGLRIDPTPTTAFANNNRSTQPSREVSRRQSNRRDNDRTSRPLANTLTNSTPVTANTSTAVNRVRAQRSDVRPAAEDRRRRGRTGDLVRNQRDSNSVRATSNRSTRSTVNLTRAQPTVALSTQNTRTTNRSNRRTTTVNRGQRIAPAETRSRSVRQAPSRQRSAPPVRRTEPARTISRSSAPAPSRSTRSASQNTRSSSNSRSARSSSSVRSTPSASRQSSQNNRRSRGSRREP